MSPSKTRARRIVRVAIGLIAALFGFGVYTFLYADGGSYLSEDPRACINCHIMESQYDSWQKGSHHGFTTCNDCHLPKYGIEKWLAKIKNGWNHSTAFTFQNFHEPIRLTEENADILQKNCVRCHADLTHAMAEGPEGSAEALRCVHCHRSVGHGETAGLGGRMRDHEVTEVDR